MPLIILRAKVLDCNPEQRDGCSFGNAGMIVPSHFVPLAAPGMVALGLKWMSPGWIRTAITKSAETKKMSRFSVGKTRRHFRTFSVSCVDIQKDASQSTW